MEIDVETQFSLEEKKETEELLIDQPVIVDKNSMNFFFLNFFVGVPHLATFIFLYFLIILNQNWVPKIYSGMAFTPFPSSILDEIRTHNFKIMS
jgi:hypothetical protein